MNDRRIFFAVLGLIWFSCSQPKPFRALSADNPLAIPDTAFESFEDLSNPKFAALKAKYQFDTIFHGETDEFRRILLLRHWIHNAVAINNAGPYPGDGSVESILDEGLKGHGFHCGHFTAVQNAVMNAYGYIARCLLADTGLPNTTFFPDGGHHAINEVWVNKYHKWVLSDAKYDYHFEKDGVPLSGLEIRDEYLKNKAADIVLVKGPGRVRTEMLDLSPDPTVSKEQFASVYTWLSWGKFNNRYSNYPNTKTDYMLLYNDEFFRNHTWYWGGKKFWAYGTEYMILVDERKAIEWTPNVISSTLSIEQNVADIRLTSVTPNLKAYQMKRPGGEWEDISNPVRIELKDDTSRYFFRTLNLAGVAGPEHQITFTR